MRTFAKLYDKPSETWALIFRDSMDPSDTWYTMESGLNEKAVDLMLKGARAE